MERKPIGRPPMYGERKKILIALPLDLLSRLDAKAEAKQITRTAAMQMAVEKWVGTTK